MGWLFFPRLCARSGTGPTFTLLVLALFKQFQLPAQNQDFLLLAGHGVVKLPQHILLVGQLGL